jgi:hypothetical protein
MAPQSQLQSNQIKYYIKLIITYKDVSGEHFFFKEWIEKEEKNERNNYIVSLVSESAYIQQLLMREIVRTHGLCIIESYDTTYV